RTSTTRSWSTLVLRKGARHGKTSGCSTTALSISRSPLGSGLARCLSMATLAAGGRVLETAPCRWSVLWLVLSELFRTRGTGSSPIRSTS
ncbi:unnamed protein product, partial [Ectocarpus sp. 8 AP-2014]